MEDLAISEARKLKFTIGVCQAVNRCFDISQIMSEISDTLMDCLPVRAVCLYNLDSDICRLSWATGISDDVRSSPDMQTINYSSAYARRCIRHKSIFFLKGERHEATSFAAHMAREGMHSIAWIPVQAKGRLLGLLALAGDDDALPALEANEDVLEFLGCEVGMGIIASTTDAELHTKLRDMEAKHRFLYDDAPAMYFALDAEGTITHCNSTVLRALGYGSEELIGRSITALLEGYDDKLRIARAGRKSRNARVEFETVVRDKRGQEHDVLALSKSLPDSDERELGTILILEDVTERNRLESENQYKSLLVDNSTDTMFVRVINDGSILYANEASWRSRGYTREEFLKLLPKDLSPKEFQEGDRLDHLHEEFIKEGGYTITAPQICKDGSIREMELTSRLLEHRGKILATVIMRDLTERNRLQRELERVGRIESLGRLAAGLSHDFNNMLVGIIGHASLLKAQSSPDAQTHKSADTIEKTASHAAQIVSRLTVFAGGEEPRIEFTNLNDIAEDVISLLSGILPHNIEVIKVIDPDTLCIEADRAQLMQCGLNLCLNARDAMPDGGTLRIKTFRALIDKPFHAAGRELLPYGVYAGFTVRDTGVGMDDETQRKVFEPYFTTKAPNEGHGFGLATTYGIVRRHGGYVNVRSAPGVGARFILYFPIVEASGTIEKEAPRHIPAAHGTIMVVEDDETVRDFLNIALTKAGYTIILAENGETALKEYSSRSADIAAVILDLRMPGMSGEEVCVELMKIDPGARILISSGYSDADTQLRGVRGYLRKPYRLSELLKAVRSAIGE